MDDLVGEGAQGGFDVEERCRVLRRDADRASFTHQHRPGLCLLHEVFRDVLHAGGAEFEAHKLTDWGSGEASRTCQSFTGGRHTRQWMAQGKQMAQEIMGLGRP